MMTWDKGVLTVSLTAIVVFVVAFRVSGLIARTLAALTIARQTMAVISDRTLDDDLKEKMVQRASLRLAGQFGLITLMTTLVLAAPIAVMWGANLIGLAPFSAVYDFLLRWEVIVGSTAAILVVIWLVRGKKADQK